MNLMNICGKYIIFLKKKFLKMNNVYFFIFFLVFFMIFGFSNFSEKLNILIS